MDRQTLAIQLVRRAPIGLVRAHLRLARSVLNGASPRALLAESEAYPTTYGYLLAVLTIGLYEVLP